MPSRSRTLGVLFYGMALAKVRELEAELAGFTWDATTIERAENEMVRLADKAAAIESLLRRVAVIDEGSE